MRPLLVWRGYWIDEGYVMSEFKGTPGPWEIDRHGTIVHGSKNGFGRKETVMVRGVALPGRTTPEYAANSNLVATAPELLEALMSMVSRIEYYATLADADKPNIEDWAYTYNSTDMDVARQAIKKALGN